MCCCNWCVTDFIMPCFVSLFRVVAACGVGIASASVAVAIGCAIPNVKNVTELGPVIFVPQLLFAGFFVKMSQVPVFLQWAQYLCSMKYTMNLILLLEFDANLPACTSSAAAAHNCSTLLDANSIDKKLWWMYVLLLFAIFCLFRIIGVIVLVAKSKRFY